jgi:hypothetical protein
MLLLPAGAGAGGGGEEEGGGGAEEGAEEGQAPAQAVRAQDQEHRRGAEAPGTVQFIFNTDSTDDLLLNLHPCPFIE